MSALGECRMLRATADALSAQLAAGGLTTVERARVLAQLREVEREYSAVWSLARHECEPGRDEEEEAQNADT